MSDCAGSDQRVDTPVVAMNTTPSGGMWFWRMCPMCENAVPSVDSGLLLRHRPGKQDTEPWKPMNQKRTPLKQLASSCLTGSVPLGGVQ